ncbi:GrpB family protein [Alicyclobacillus macrosporangiidus]|uniref:GrpB family protein n=1 Tax=Alicyclobacillus macrosporangiidus TaxID=392015 RepID=UPI0009E062FD|nr:GrpB family protein [Alicyclobacillus macrosporangiidus]
MNLSIIVVPYDPGWLQAFEMIRSYVSPVLSDIVVAIEHVGSTSVPGLAAKPIVDIDVAVATRDDVYVAIQRLASLGYIHEGDLGIAGREAFIPPNGLPPHHLYVCTADNTEYERHILFRDYLRSHPEEAELYGALIRELAQRFPNDRASYTNGKSEFVNAILKRAAWKPQ